MLSWMHILPRMKAVVQPFLSTCPSFWTKSDKPRYAKELKTIVQTLQAKKASGDGKQKQAKMTALDEVAQKRVKEAKLLAGAAAKRGSRQNTERSGGTAWPAPPKKKKRENNTTLAEAQQTLRDVTEEYD